MIIHDNQPIQFNVPTVIDCNCDDIQYRQLVNINDVSQYQIELEVCGEAIQLIVNGQFVDTALLEWSNPSGLWFAQDFKACFFNPASGDLSQDVLFPDRYYKTTLDVTELNPGSSLEVYYGINQVGTILAAGSYEFYGFNDDTNNNFTIRANGIGGKLCIDNVIVKEVNLDVIVALLDENDTIVVKRLLKDFITQIPVGIFNINEINGDEFILSRQYLTAFFNWSDESVVEGCYHLAVIDNCANLNAQSHIPNGEMEWPKEQFFGATPFATLQPWEITEVGSGDLDITGGEMAYIGTLGGDSATATQEILGVGKSYNYDIKVNSVTGNASLTVTYGTVTIGPITAIGTYTGNITADATDLNIQFRFDGTMDVEYIRHEMPNGSLEFDQVGVGMNYDNHSCTLLINACNDSDGFNFGFGDTGFSPTVRVKSKLINAQFPTTRNVEFNSKGRARNIYFNRRKSRILRVDYQPEYVLDFLTLLPGFEHFYIDTVEFNVDEDYEPLIEYGEQDTIGQLDIDVIVKEDLIKRAACTPVGAGCALPPNILLQENGSAILGENGEFILITG